MKISLRFVFSIKKSAEKFSEFNSVLLLFDFFFSRLKTSLSSIELELAGLSNFNVLGSIKSISSR